MGRPVSDEVDLSVQNRDTDSRMSQLPFVQRGAQIAIDVHLRHASSKRNRERIFAFEYGATLECAYEVDEVFNQFLVDTNPNEEAPCFRRQPSPRNPPINGCANRDTGQRASKPSETPQR